MAINETNRKSRRQTKFNKEQIIAKEEREMRHMPMYHQEPEKVVDMVAAREQVRQSLDVRYHDEFLEPLAHSIAYGEADKTDELVRHINQVESERQSSMKVMHVQPEVSVTTVIGNVVEHTTTSTQEEMYQTSFGTLTYMDMVRELEKMLGSDYVQQVVEISNMFASGEFDLAERTLKEVKAEKSKFTEFKKDLNISAPVTKEVVEDSRNNQSADMNVLIKDYINHAQTTQNQEQVTMEANQASKSVVDVVVSNGEEKAAKKQKALMEKIAELKEVINPKYHEHVEELAKCILSGDTKKVDKIFAKIEEEESKVAKSFEEIRKDVAKQAKENKKDEESYFSLPSLKSIKKSIKKQTKHVMEALPFTDRIHGEIDIPMDIMKAAPAFEMFAKFIVDTKNALADMDVVKNTSQAIKTHAA